jgi:hypothetical protein
MPWSFAQIWGIGALHHHLVEADHGNADITDRFPLGRIRGPCRCDRRSGGQLVQGGRLRQGVTDLRVVGLLLELAPECVLGMGLLDRGSPDLVRREEQEQNSRPDEKPPEDVYDPSKR